MRSREEIAFRLSQEARNLWLLASRPELPLYGKRAAAASLPDPEAVVKQLRGSRFAAEARNVADEILRHRFPLLGTVVETGKEIHWRRDYQRGIETGMWYFRCIPYLDAARAGDHKIIWELNRHQHLVLLAQVHRLYEDKQALAEIVRELESWMRANRFQCGINWASALEVGFRALSWIWVWHLAGDRLEARFRTRWRQELYRHGLHLRNNLSFYFSPNTHLLGEAVALHALGALFPEFPEEWRETGARVVREQLERQVRADGSHFEQSSYYHVYALDMFLFHAVLEGCVEEFRGKLERMGEYLAALMGPAGTLPQIGDDDGGRFFHPYGQREEFGRATLATCGVLLDRPEWIREEEDLYPQAIWWLGPLQRVAAPAVHGPRWFPQAGTAVMGSGRHHVLIDAGPFAPESAGHSHADTLSLVVRSGSEEILVDAGTYTYVEPKWRDWFRGTAAHNTMRIDGHDQAVAAGSFRWREQPEVRVLAWAEDLLDAECRYAGFVHRRRVKWMPPDLLFVLDEVRGAGGVHRLEQFWHPGEAVRRISAHCFCIGKAALVLAEGSEIECSEGGEHGWRSPVFGRKVAAPVICARRETELPSRLAAVMVLSELTGAATVAVREEGERVRIGLEGSREAVVEL